MSRQEADAMTDESVPDDAALDAAPTDAPSDGPEAASTMTDEEKFARYRHLRANVRKRRLGLVLCIVLAIAVFVVTIVDIAAIDSKGKWYLLPLYIILLVVAIILLLSRAKPEEKQELRDLERLMLQCPSCRKVFRFSEVGYSHDDKLVFSCPHCGVFSRHPHAGARPQPVPRPAGDIVQRTYTDEAGEKFTFGLYQGRSGSAPTFVDVKIRGKGDLVHGDDEVVPDDHSVGNPPPEAT